MSRKKNFVIQKPELDGLEILALMLDQEADAVEKNCGDALASEITRMSVGDITIAQALRAFASWLRGVAQSVRK